MLRAMATSGKKGAAKKGASKTARSAAGKPVKKAPAKAPPAKAPAKKAPAKKAPAKKAPAKKAPAKKAPAKKTPTKKAPGKNAPAPGKKTPTKKAPGKKAPPAKAPGKKTPTKKAPGKKAPPAKAPGKKTPTKKAPGKKAPPAKAPAKKTPARKTPAKAALLKPVRKASDELTPVAARPTRTVRTRSDERLAEIDATCAAWADIVAERMAADQNFADLVEQVGQLEVRDLRGLFLWDALQAAEAHVSLINDVLAAHIVDRRADPVAILDDLRARQLRVAAVYAVNAFLAVLNQMKPEKPKWLAMDDLDPRFAVLALAHQTLGYALEALRIEATTDLTDHILAATQDEAVWVWRRMPEPGTDTIAACAAAAAFFRSLGADRMTSTDEVAALYGEHAKQRATA